MDLSYNLVSIVIGISVLLLCYIKYLFKYWERRGVPSIVPNIPLGSAYPLMTAQKHFGEVVKEAYEKSKPKGLKHVGLYLLTKPSYIPIDPLIIKHIIQLDFDVFMNRGIYINERDDPLSAHIINAEGTHWKFLRQKLSPTFTSGQMKNMFQTLVDTTEGLLSLMESTLMKQTDIDIKDILACYATDIISSCAFGLESNSMKDPNSEFRKYGKTIFDQTFWRNIKTVLSFIIPFEILRAIRFYVTDKDLTNFFLDITKSTVNYREKNNYHRKDFMHLLIQLKNRGKISTDEKLTDDENNGNSLTIEQMAAQSFLFFSASFETSSATMTFALYELAQDHQIQDKVRNEINEVLAKHGGKITYESVMQMKYLEQVVNESLRKYPPVPVLARRCTKDYTIPGTNIVLEKGTDVIIPVWGLHRDEEYYPNPDKFDPERFTEENKSKIPQYTYLPFGEGPRICLGLRFGMLQSKVGLISVLQNYKISLSPRTKKTLEYNPKMAIFLSPKEIIWFNVEKIENSC